MAATNGNDGVETPNASTFCADSSQGTPGSQNVCMRKLPLARGLLLALLQPLPCLFDIAVKNEESIGIAVGIREVEELPFRSFTLRFFSR